ncbi:sarcosine oxidase subunit gamma [Sulfitobacter delicatus]|uniref:Sarcosine oxidase subunit gamma n=1 Tax=Sulfitobacter delicatus TaxID=218672 RepID=A0A1G7NNR0_9RHOB|nr:sarcosine oxidase subunit gamma family protein [Sulfitobacter delicatus]SDF75616.1 sarcosine oxidase subunit gamma [Sulfitobacter delicatus]
MAELKAQNPFADLLPLKIGGVSVDARDLGHLTVLGDLGNRAALAEALEQAHGLALPEPLRSTENGATRCIWLGSSEVLLIGTPPDAALTKVAAVVDVSDGWAAVQLSGVGAEDVLARLVPVDVRTSVFERGHTLRSQLREMPVSITRNEGGFLLLVPRSVAATMVQELRRAMEAVASRR